MDDLFDVARFASELCAALNDRDVADLVIVPGVMQSLQRGTDDEQGGQVVGVASWTLGELYRTSVKHLSDDDVDTTVGVLVACPGHLRAWNIRKRWCNDVDKELHFNALILRRAPKAAEAWAHRRWLLRRGCEDVESEFVLVRHAMRRAFANYYAGVHFMLYLRNRKDVVRWCREFLATHPRDATGWAVYRVALQGSDGALELDAEEVFVRDMLQRYAASQAVCGHAKWWTVWREKLDADPSR